MFEDFVEYKYMSELEYELYNASREMGKDEVKEEED